MHPRHQRFTQEYIIDRNGAAAARRAGFSPGRARVTASELLRHPDIKQALRNHEAMLCDAQATAVQQQAAERVDIVISEERILRELAQIAFAPLSEDAARWPPGLVNAKRAALVNLGEHFGMFKERPATAVTVEKKYSDIELARWIADKLLRVKATPKVIEVPPAAKA